ncbi:unnamed protein product [Lactuca virosa]|uniref:Aminotransferase-like plant mobile domain-containing protein n=1 Tax=Lactuca virosa TaxID=75947 RepID=A0AAU9MZA4_9ASTR|nr:unnamed protein product [Lactuca virosa]
MGYTEVLTTVIKFKKSCLPPQWNGLFTLLFKGLSERVAGSDGASKAFMTLLYGLYYGINMDYGSILWTQLVQSLTSSSRYSEISCGRFWTLVTQWAMEKFHIPVMADSLKSSIATFHRTKIIVSDPTKFLFISLIPETMYHCVSGESKLIREYKKLPPTGPRQLTPEMQRSLDAADKPAKRGKKGDQRKNEKEGPSSKAAMPKKRKSEQAAPFAYKKRKIKKKAPKPKAPSSSDSEYVPFDQQPERESSNSEHSQDESSLRGDSPPPSPADQVNRNSPPSSPTRSVPITIAPCPPPIFSTTVTSKPIPTPLFIKITTTTTTPTEPQVRVNVSDTGAPTSGTETPITSKPLSPPHSNESDTVIGGEDADFDSFYFSPYRVQSDDDDDAPVTKRHLKDLNEKLDKLIASASSSSTTEYIEAAVKALFSTLVKEHQDSIEKATKAVDASTTSCQKAAENVDKIIYDAQVFLDSLQAAAQKNANMVNATIKDLTTTLQEEHKHFESIRKGIQADNAEFVSSVKARLDQLQTGLAVESKVMDELDRRTAQLKTQTLKLTLATKEIDDLKSERAVIKSCVGDVHSLFSNLLEAHDSVLTLTVPRHLAEKLRPALEILSRIEGVPGTVVPPKQGGEASQGQPPQPPTSKPIQISSQLKVTTEPKGNEASGSSVKDKNKKIVSDSDEEETEEDALKRKQRDREIDENLRIAREEEERERKRKESHDALESRETLFPSWTLEKLLKEAIESPSTHWLEPVISFDRENSRDSQFDMLITRKAFVFHCFEPIAIVPCPDPKVDQELIDYYLAFSQPQYLTWSAQKITTVKVLKPTSAGNFIIVKLVTRGSDNSVHMISLVDLPNLNPHDWILLNNILLTDQQQYEPIIDHIKRMLVSYIHEVAKMDQEIASALRKKPTIRPIGKASDVNKMQMGRIDPKYHTVMFTRAEGQKCFFALDDKHLFSTSCLEHILDIIHRCKQNSDADKKKFSDMLRWYIDFRQTLLAIIPKLFKTVKKSTLTQPK